MYPIDTPPESMGTYSLVGEIHARLAILETLMEHPLFNRKDIRITLKRLRCLATELTGRRTR